MAKKTSTASTAVLAEPAMTTAEAVILAKQQAAARAEADKRFYVQAVKRIASGEELDGDLEAAEIIGSALGNDLRYDVDRLQKINRWTAEGYIDSEADGFHDKHNELTRHRDELARQVKAMEAELMRLRNDAARAEFDRHKFYQMGSGMTQMRKQISDLMEAAQ